MAGVQSQIVSQARADVSVRHQEQKGSKGEREREAAVLAKQASRGSDRSEMGKNGAGCRRRRTDRRGLCMMMLLSLTAVCVAAISVAGDWLLGALAQQVLPQPWTSQLTLLSSCASDLFLLKLSLARSRCGRMTLKLSSRRGGGAAQKKRGKGQQASPKSAVIDFCRFEEAAFEQRSERAEACSLDSRISRDMEQRD